MSQDSDRNIIFSLSECPDEETLQLYVQQKLDKKQVRAVELHISDCEICGDMVEGMQLAGAPDELKNDIQEIKVAAKKMLEKSETKFFSISTGTSYAIAAMIVLLIAVGFFLNNYLSSKKEQALAVIIPKEAPSEVDNVMPPTQLDEVEKPVVPAKEKVAEMPERKSLKTIPAQEQLSETEGDNALAVVDEKIKSTDANLSSGKAMMESRTAEVETAAPAPSAMDASAIESISTTGSGNSSAKDGDFSKSIKPESANKNRAESAGAAKKTSSVSASNETLSEVEEAKLDFTKGNYKTAKKGFASHLKSNPGNQESLFLLAKTERMLKEYQASNAHFDELLKFKDSPYGEEANWQKALNFKDNKQMVEARALLKLLSEGKGKYAYAAAELLGELDE